MAIKPFDIQSTAITIAGVNWEFGTNGAFKLPAGGDIVDSNNVSLLGTGGVTVITPDDTELSGISTLVFTGAGVTASSAGNAVTLDITGGGGSANIGDYTFTNSAANVPVNATLTLTAPNNTTLESKLTLSPTTKSSLYAANTLELGVAYGSGSEKYWLLGADGSMRFPDASIQTTAYTGVTTDTTPPTSPATGNLWYDTASGRTYIYYDSNWVDASPAETVPELISTTASVVSNSLTLDFNYAWTTVTLTEPVTSIVFTNPPTTGIVKSITVEFIQPAGGSCNVSSTNYLTAGGAGLDISIGSGAKSIVTFVTRDGGTTYYGFSSGKDWA